MSTHKRLGFFTNDLKVDFFFFLGIQVDASLKKKKRKKDKKTYAYILYVRQTTRTDQQGLRSYCIVIY